MEILVTLDVHLMREMFYSVAELFSSGMAERAVCLMDITDDSDPKKTFDIERFLEHRANVKLNDEYEVIDAG